MRLFFTFLLLMGCFWTDSSNAHPVSFRDSVGLMGYHSPQFSHNQVNYSWRHWIATGYHHLRRPDREEENSANLLSANLLLKRWYGDAFQGNLYAVLGGGQSDLDQSPENVGYGLLQFDIEDRKYYFLAKASRLQGEDDPHYQQHTVRAGIAPYVADFGAIHSWLILEWTNERVLDEDWTADLTPMLRVFHRNILFEIGQSFNGVTRFNFITHL